MTPKEEAVSIIKRLYESRAKSGMAKIDKNNIGMGLVLRYLEEVGRPVSAGEISRYMNVSTARVAVLLRTMSEKGLIVKDDDSSDARKIRVTLSENGKEQISKAKAELLELITEIVNKVGIERMETFLAISDEINAVITEKIAVNRK